MKTVLVGLLSASLTLAPCAPAFGWAHANAYGGGGTAHYGNTTTRTNGWGGEATHTAGQGTSYENKYGDSAYHAEGSGTTSMSNAYGGSATHYAGQGTTATSAYGGSAYHAEGSGTTEMYGAAGGSATHYAGYGTVGTTAYGTTAVSSTHYYGAAYPVGYHPPVVVNSYSTGCYNCGGWSTGAAVATGAVVGMAAGAAIASSSNAAATSNAYAAGVAAGQASVTYSIGEVVAAVPSGCVTPNVGGVTYYMCGSTWFQPSYGANGVYYRVVPTP
jgi:hypothetical protein